MRIYEILFEDIWSDVAIKWSDRDKISVDDVTNTINIFRRLVKTGKITDTTEKNIQNWSKKPFNEFQAFVDENKHKLETKGVVRSKIKSTRNEIILNDNDNWLVVIPKDKKTSQKLASDAHWCTSTKTEGNNKFDQYVCKELTTLIYLISKTSNEKYAIRFKTDGEIEELKNKRNTDISKSVFKDETGYDPVVLIAQARNSPEWREFIAVVEASPAYLSEKLCKFAENGNLDGVKYCLDHGADIHAENDQSLQIASEKGCIKIVKLLLDNGADIHAENDQSLRIASERGCIKIVKLLLANGADIHAKDDIALRHAAYNGHVELVKLLLDHGADIHADSDYALRHAAFSGYVEVVKLLLDNGADIHAKDDNAFQIASSNGRAEVVKLLLDHGADIHADSDYALRYAAYNGHVEVVKLILDHSLKINDPFSSGIIKKCMKGTYGQEILNLLKDYMEILK